MRAGLPAVLVLAALAAVGLALWPVDAPDPAAPAPAAAPETTAVSPGYRPAPVAWAPPGDTHGLVAGLQPLAPSEVVGRPPGASELGFVPETALVAPEDRPPPDYATLDLLDPEERALKRAAGDLDAPLDEEALIKAQAFTGDVLGGPAADTALDDVAPLAPTELEAHVAGQLGVPARASVAERHAGERRPTPPARSPTEADAVAEVDVTTQDDIPPPLPDDAPLYADTRTPAEPVPTWDGPGTDTAAGP